MAPGKTSVYAYVFYVADCYLSITSKKKNRPPVIICKANSYSIKHNSENNVPGYTAQKNSVQTIKNIGNLG
jgi:hypothetical protein